MAKTLQFRRGTSAELDSITGAEGEIFIDLDTNSIRVHDGNTSGGFALATSTDADSAYSNAVAYVDAELGALVNNAPGVLDTLNELADALGDDENFFVTVNNNINTAYSNAVSYTDTEITNLNLGTVSTQDANSINITGGSITIDSFVASGITYPSADGSNGQVIATDGSGSLSFTDLPPSSDSFARTLALWGLA